MTDNWLPALLTGFSVTFVVTPILRWLALRVGMVDHPESRKVHTAPVPYVGGIAIIIGTVTALIIGPGLSFDAVAIGVVAGGLGVVGLIDDRYSVRVLPRLVAQIGAACVAVGVGVQVTVSGVSWLDAALTVLWIVTVTNATNLVDNMDGQSAGYVAVSSAGMLGLAILADQIVVASVAASLVGVCTGFLIWNLSRWRVFMGDTGSLFLGFAVSVTVVEVSPLFVSSRAGRLIALLLVAVPLLDLVTVVVGRLRHGISIGTAGRDHLAHRLVIRGLSPRFAVFVLVVVQGTLVLVAVGIGAESVPVGAGLLVAAAVLGLLGNATWRSQVYEQEAKPGRVLPVGLAAVALGLAAISASLMGSRSQRGSPAALVDDQVSGGASADVTLGAVILFVLSVAMLIGIASFRRMPGPDASLGDSSER